MAWCKFPSRWIKEGKLAQMRWTGKGATETAALLLLIGIAIKINYRTLEALREADPDETPVPAARTARITYDEFMSMAGISRAKVAAGLVRLRELDVIDVQPEGRNILYAIPQTLRAGDWCQLPQFPIYQNRVLRPFMGFRLREKWELHTLMLYLTLLTFKNNGSALAPLTYAKIEEYTEIRRTDIRHCIDHLINLGLVRLAPEDAATHPLLRSNIYRLSGFDRRKADTA
jgi:hypothetical protein